MQGPEIVSAISLTELRYLVAVDEERQVRLDYFAASRGGVATDRVVDPWRFVDGLLTGWCHLRTAERTFAVDRIGRVRLLPATIDHRPGPEDG